MKIYMTAIHLAGGTKHEHIQRLRWRSAINRETGDSSREEIIKFLRDSANSAWVNDGRHEVQVRIVEGNPPYLRTHADGYWTDNLLALPRF